MRRRKWYSVDRLGAVSDGVFAVALTLLVLTFRVPDPGIQTRPLQDSLVDNGPVLLGWVVSFVIIARLWAVHHDTVHGIRRCSPATIVANFAFLGTLSLIPFGADLVGTYGLTEYQAIQVFSGLIALCSVALGWFIRRTAMDNAAVPGAVGWSRQALHHLLVVPVAAVVACVAAAIVPQLGLAVWAIESVVVVVVLLTAGEGGELTDDAGHETPRTGT